MKKLSKLNINHERLIKNEDLQELRGGWLGQCVLLEDGAYYDTIQWICWGMTYAWECDNWCEQNHSGFTCVCNFPY